MANQIIQSIKTIAQSLVDKAGYDKTRGGVIVGVNSVTNTYSVKVDGVTYPIVRAVDGATYNVGDVVKVVIPCNQATQMYIASSVLSDNSLGNKIANAVGLAQDAAKVATNYIEQDDTDGLIFGDKTSGTWSGYHSQILSDRFNILDESSTVLASFGTTTVIGEEAKANMHLTFNNLSMVDANGTEFFKVGDTRNADGIATLKSIATPYIDSTGSVTLIFESSISSVISVYVNSVELSSSNYSVSGKRITFRNLTPNSRPTIETTFTTTEPSFYLTFGNRLSSGKTGKYSVAEGKDVIASGFASRAEGVNTEASGEYSHAGGYHTKASGDCSYAGGYWTVADGDYVTAIGRYNRKYTGINDKVFVIGNGSSDTNRSNALAVDWNGNLTLGTPLSVENGGTGATTAAAARANLEIYQRELVWDNANDTQKFAAQTIALDLSSYDYAEVHFFVSSTYDERVVGIGIIHERASHIYAQVMSNVDTSDTPIYVTQRVADVSANGVTFSDAYTKFITSTSTQQNNNRMVPTKIYAFKALEA